MFSFLVKAFCTYVRPLVEYCTSVWNPHFNYLIDKVERVQRHFTKCINGLKNVSYPNRLIKLGLQSLDRRRLNFDLILVYKILHGLTDTELSTNFIPQQYTSTRGHDFKLVKQFCPKDIYKFFFFKSCG